MAAILGRVLCFPCRATCGANCDCNPDCGCIQQCCSAPCSCISCLCGGCFGAMRAVYNRPMGCCLLFSGLVTIIPAACAIAYGVKADGAECGSPIDMATWLYICAAVQLLNFLFALRTFCKFDMPYNPADPKDKDYITRMNHFMCYDPSIACYFVIVAFQFAWQIVGHVVKSNIDPSTCPEHTQNMGDAAITLVWVFFAVGFLIAVAGYLSEWMETRCCPYFAGTSCGICVRCLCPGLFSMFMSQDGRRPVTSTGKPTNSPPGLALTPVVAMPVVPPGPPRLDQPPVVYPARSYAAQAYAGGHSVPPHQRMAVVAVPYAQPAPRHVADHYAIPAATAVDVDMGMPKR